MLTIGDTAPAFSLKDANHNTVSLSQFLGKKVVLYFYPKDDTSGCTKEAQEFTESMEKFVDENTVILGVSKDSPESHQKFTQKYDLTVTLLSDPSGNNLNDYGVWQEKSMLGKKYMGIVRTTYLINVFGYIQNIWNHVEVDGHVESVLACTRDV